MQCADSRSTVEEWTVKNMWVRSGGWLLADEVTVDGSIVEGACPICEEEVKSLVVVAGVAAASLDEGIDAEAQVAGSSLNRSIMAPRALGTTI